MASYREHYKRQFTNDHQDFSDVACPLPRPEPRHITFPETEVIFAPAAIRKRIKFLAKGKAAGTIGIMGEVLQAAGEVIVEVVQCLFLAYSQWATFPTPWTLARIQPVPKKGDLTKIKNYRPISLTEIPRKLFEGLLLPHLTTAPGNCVAISSLSIALPSKMSLSIEQGGFRAGRGTLEQVSVLQEWILQATSAKQQRLMAFLDIKAAYDSVDWYKLWQKCLQRGLPERIVGLLRGLFDHNRAYVAIAGRESDRFNLEAGVLQGSLLSPLLYSVFIDDLVLALNQRGPEDVVYVYVSDRGYQSIHISTRPFRCLL